MDDLNLDMPQRRSYQCPKCTATVEIIETTKTKVEDNRYTVESEMKFNHPAPINKDCKDFQAYIVMVEEEILQQRMQAIFGRMAIDVPHPLPPL